MDLQIFVSAPTGVTKDGVGGSHRAGVRSLTLLLDHGQGRVGPAVGVAHSSVDAGGHVQSTVVRIHDVDFLPALTRDVHSGSLTCRQSVDIRLAGHHRGQGGRLRGQPRRGRAGAQEEARGGAARRDPLSIAEEREGGR